MLEGEKEKEKESLLERSLEVRESQEVEKNQLLKRNLKVKEVKEVKEENRRVKSS